MSQKQNQTFEKHQLVDLGDLIGHRFNSVSVLNISDQSEGKLSARRLVDGICLSNTENNVAFVIGYSGNTEKGSYGNNRGVITTSSHPTKHRNIATMEGRVFEVFKIDDVKLAIKAGLESKSLELVIQAQGTFTDWSIDSVNGSSKAEVRFSYEKVDTSGKEQFPELASLKVWKISSDSVFDAWNIDKYLGAPEDNQVLAQAEKATKPVTAKPKSVTTSQRPVQKAAKKTVVVKTEKARGTPSFLKAD